ncbi:MAG: hypothetical protein R3D67_06295 [Hyphomicrobiaceae bacterium]
MQTAEPTAWRKLLDEHAAAARARLPRLKPEDGEPMRRQAIHDLEAERQSLASLNDGRKDAIYWGGCTPRTLYGQRHPDDAGDRCRRSSLAGIGAAAKHGFDYARGAIRRALEAGRNDPLPPLMQLPPAQVRRQATD